MAECVVSLPTDQAKRAMVSQYIGDILAGPLSPAIGVTDTITLYLGAVDACEYRNRAGVACTHPRSSCGSCPISRIEAYRNRLKPYVQGV